MLILRGKEDGRCSNDAVRPLLAIDRFFSFEYGSFLLCDKIGWVMSIGVVALEDSAASILDFWAAGEALYKY